MAKREYRYVNSSNVKGVAYDQDTSTLYVQFNSGSEYSYLDVPEDEYEALLSAPSVGTYLNDNIKNSYIYQRV